MRSEARLDSAVFQLTPTRTRCDLVISVNGKTEKLASGLLNPFLAHLKTAQDQIAKGGYSITLEPDPATNAFWFTKGTVEKFVRFVSTPEVLERVATIESEILQIEDAITVQGNESLGLSIPEESQMRSTAHIEGSKPAFDADAEKAIVLYKPGSQSNPMESNGPVVQEENSKVQLLRVLETRRIVLQKEQGMAFARASAAGFDMDLMAHLILFAECFGASRLKEACLKFMELWKVKHETGQWIEVEAAEAMSTRSGFSPFNVSGIVLAGDAGKQNVEALSAPGGDLGMESNGNDVVNHSSDKRLPPDTQVPSGPPEYFQGQFQHPMFPPWAMHPPSGPAVYQPYPMQAMPYYQNYPGGGPFYPPPYPSTEDPRLHTRQRLGRRHSMNSKDNDVYSETWEENADQSLSESETGTSRGHKSHKRGGRSGKKKHGVVVVKKHDKSGAESQSDTNSETEDESEDFHSDTAERKQKKSSRSSKKNDHKKAPETSNAYDGDEMDYGNNAGSGNWQAFQGFLLRAEEKMTSTTDGDILAGEKVPSIKRRQNLSEAEPILTPERDFGNNHEARNLEFDSSNGKGSRTRKLASSDELLTSSEGRGLRESHLDAQFIEVESGAGRYRRMTTEDFMIHGQEIQQCGKTSSDPLADGYDYGHPANMEKSPYVATDESFMVPFRAGSNDQLEIDYRTAIDMDSELPISLQRKEDSSNNATKQLTYEPDDLTMLPERAFDSDYIGYDPAMDYDMEIPVEVSVKQETNDAEDISIGTKEELKSDKDKKLKVSQDGPEKRRRDAMLRRGVSSKSSPLTEAQKRAEKLRAYKVDLQKEKKANEEEERKRLEALKIERQKRIAARSGSNSVQSPLATKQVRSGLPLKVSPSSFKGSKFSDSEPGTSSPLHKVPIKGSSIGSNDSQKGIKTSRTNGTTNGLTKSVSSLPELKNENNGLIPEAKTAATRNRRLSDPSVKTVQHASQKSVATDQIPKRSSAGGPQMKKISAIVQLDKTKSAALPELKIRTPRGPSDTLHNKSVIEGISQQGPISARASRIIQENDTTENPPRASNNDDTAVIEKTVVMLESGINTCPVLEASVSMVGTLDEAKGKTGHDSEYAAIRASPSPVVVEEVGDPNQHKPDEQQDFYEVVTNVPKDGSQNFSKSVTENFYRAPHARASSLEDPAASDPDHTGAPNEQSESISIPTESIKARVKFSDSCEIDQSNEVTEKPRGKESKGFRKLLKFGRKNQSSAPGEGNIDSDGSVADDQMEPGSSNDVHMLKNLISQDDGHAGGTPPRGHRSFSILSAFRSNKSNEKKLAA